MTNPPPQASPQPLPLMDNGKPETSNQPAPIKHKHKTWGWLLLLLVGLLMALYYFQPAPVKPLLAKLGLARTSPLTTAQDNPTSTSAAQPQTVVGLGRLTPQGKIISLSLPYGAGDARIATLMVKEGDTLAAGATVAELDSLPQLRASLATAAANLATQQASLAQTRVNVAASLLEAQAALDRAQAAAELAERESQRQKQLLSREAVSKVQLDNSEIAALQAKRERDRLASVLSRWQGDEAQADLAVAKSKVAAAEAELSRAQADLARGLVTAPSAGTIIELLARPGEKPGTDGIATFGDITHMEAELEIYQTDIAQVKLGQPVTITSPALSQPLTATVKTIGLQVERQTVLSTNPAANTDARVIRVTVALDEASAARARNFTGLEVTGRITLAAEALAATEAQ